MKMRPLIVVCLLIVSFLVVTLATNCKKDDSNDPETVTDIDGNIYKTVTIGTQIWMKENLRTSRYNNGDPIPEITDGAQWMNLSSGAYCNYDNNASYADTYGLLYNWYVVKDARNICPAGWHIPENNEWATLIDFLGGEEVAGGKLKEKGTTHWNSPNTDAKDTYGFRALPAGYRFGDSFYPPGYYAIWWSLTEKNNADAWIITLINTTSKSYLESSDKPSGLSIRCLKD